VRRADGGGPLGQGRAKVCEPQVARRGEKEVARLHVAVQHAALPVQVAQRVQRRCHRRRHLLLAQRRAAAPHHVEQRAGLAVLGDEPELTFEGVRGEVAEHVLALAQPRAPSKALRLDHHLRRRHLLLGRDHLDGDLPPVRATPRAVDAAVRAAPDLALELVERPVRGHPITADGAVWSWGTGKLGHGDTQTQTQPLPKKVEAIAGRRVVAVSAGEAHSLALTADGAVFAWGEGERARLGHGEDLSNQLLPKKIETWALGQ